MKDTVQARSVQAGCSILPVYPLLYRPRNLRFLDEMRRFLSSFLTLGYSIQGHESSIGANFQPTVLPRTSYLSGHGGPLTVSRCPHSLPRQCSRPNFAWRLLTGEDKIGHMGIIFVIEEYTSEQ